MGLAGSGPRGWPSRGSIASSRPPGILGWVLVPGATAEASGQCPQICPGQRFLSLSASQTGPCRPALLCEPLCPPPARAPSSGHTLHTVGVFPTAPSQTPGSSLSLQEGGGGSCPPPVPGQPWSSPGGLPAGAATSALRYGSAFVLCPGCCGTRPPGAALLDVGPVTCQHPCHWSLLDPACVL